MSYRCPYCHLPLTDADATKDGDALWCADCAQRVEYYDAIEAYEESVSHSVFPPTEPSNSVAE